MSPRQYWTVLREDRWIVVGVLLVCLLGALLLDVFLPRTYTSSAVFYVASAQAEPSPTDAYSGQQLATERVKSYSEVLKGPRVARDASLLLGGSPTAEEIQGAVTASYVEETVVLTLDVTERSPDQARLVAGAVSAAFTRLVGSIESTTNGVVNRPVATAEVILPPTEPAEPSGPPTTILFGGALVLGLVLGFGAALIRRALRDTVDTPEDLAQRLDAPLLGAVPALRRPPEHPALLAEPPLGADGRQARLLRSRAEAYRRIRTALLSGGGGRRALVLTAAGPGQGTSTTAVDLAIALAATGDSVVLVEADLRRPRLAATLGLRGAIGLRDVLERGRDLDAAVQRFARGRIDVITAGEAALGGEAAAEPLVGALLGPLLATLRERYDHVLVDTPPVTAAADAADVARHADGVVLVCRRGRTRATDIDVAASTLSLGGATVLGAVITWATGVREAAPTVRPVLALPPGPSAGEPAGPGPGGRPTAPPEPDDPAPAHTGPTGPGATDAPESSRTVTARTRAPRTRTPKAPAQPASTDAVTSDVGEPATTTRRTTRKTTTRKPTTRTTPAETPADTPTGTPAETPAETPTGTPAETPPPPKAKRTTTGARSGTSPRRTKAEDPAGPSETPTARVRPRRSTTGSTTAHDQDTGRHETGRHETGSHETDGHGNGHGARNGTSASSTNGYGT